MKNFKVFLAYGQIAIFLSAASVWPSIREYKEYNPAVSFWNVSAECSLQGYSGDCRRVRLFLEPRALSFKNSGIRTVRHGTQMIEVSISDYKQYGRTYLLKAKRFLEQARAIADTDPNKGRELYVQGLAYLQTAESFDLSRLEVGGGLALELNGYFGGYEKAYDQLKERLGGPKVIPAIMTPTELDQEFATRA